MPINEIIRRPFEIERFVLSAGDKLLLYTDGVTEAPGDGEDVSTATRRFWKICAGSVTAIR